MNKRYRKVLSAILAVIITITGLTINTPKKIISASEYIKVDEFAKELAKELGFKSIKGTESSGYVNALLKEGIIKEGEIASYSNELTRTDMALMLNRADEYLYGDKLDPKLVELTLEKRISDIKKIKKDKRTDVVKCYLKGFIKGHSNGEYSSDRAFKGGGKVVKASAMNCIKMLKDKKLRAKISPDGQLIRTTNLPKNAKDFPYILASYPNAYYEWKFKYQTAELVGMNNKTLEKINLVDYASPKNINKLNIDRYNDFTKIKNQNIDIWVDKAKRHMELVFSADYRSINNDWKEELIKVDYSYNTNSEKFSRDNIDRYISKMKKNKTILEYSKITIDRSSLYYFNSQFYLRAYVKFRIKSSIQKLNVNSISERPFDKIVLNKGWADLRGVTLGEWYEGYYDITLVDYDGSGDLGVVGILFYKGAQID